MKGQYLKRWTEGRQNKKVATVLNRWAFWATIQQAGVVEDICRELYDSPSGCSASLNVPGSEFNYNNTGYALMTEVIKRVTGTPFPEWMKVNVFEPLEMHHTVVRTPKSNRGKPVGWVLTWQGRIVYRGDRSWRCGRCGRHSLHDG
jgi:CubicO group peptidase (beta-lactamase class C family)